MSFASKEDHVAIDLEPVAQPGESVVVDALDSEVWTLMGDRFLIRL
ncbi:MAG: hypothetical protein V2I43_27050 [Parvularcula sp.]|nr:hypothetical protein [Parvularcula sp.]